MERHEAIVAGAGPAGLAAAAVLRKRGFETLVLERTGAVGARWRTRYEGLRLNTMRTFSTLPGHRMGLRAGRYPSRDAFVAYLERYAVHHALPIRFGTALERVDRDEGGWWRLETPAGPLLARYVVVATGYDAVRWLPDWAARADDFAGELVHAGDVRSPAAYRGREVLVVGAGNTGVDLAGHLIAAGAGVTLSMRTPPNLFRREVFGSPAQPAAILLDRLPSRIGDAVGFFTQRITFGDLEPYGIPRAPEGFQSKYRRTLVGAAVDDGFVDALKAGRTRVVAEVDRLEGADAVLVDGTRLQPDAVICATGYRRGLEPIVGHLGVLRPDGLPIHYERAAPEHPARSGARPRATVRRWGHVLHRRPPDRPSAHPRADGARGARAQRAHARLGRHVRARPRRAQRRGRLVLPAARSVADLPRARLRPEGLGRRRQ